ncbi:MAG: hypothetical protein ACOY0T_24450 [Myxococcota bacterium]
MKEASDDLAMSSLPPLDVGEEADELDDDAVGGLLDPLPQLDSNEDDDSSALETGTESFDIAGEDVEEGSTTIDLAGVTEELLMLPDEAEPADEGEGMAGAEPVWITTPEALEPRDDSEGLDEPVDAIGVLPALTEGDDLEGVEDPGELPASTRFGDEPRPRAAEQQWTLAGPDLKLEPCAALASIEGIVVAASTDLFWFTAGSLTPMRLEAGSSHIHSVALLGSGWEFAACATASGKLFRRGRLASSSEELRRIREEVGLSGREVFELCQPGLSFPHTLLLRTAGGKLLRSDDDGGSFRRVSERKIVALAPQGAPALALAAEGLLLISEDGAGTFREVQLEALALRAARGKAPLIAGHAQALLLAEPSFGVLVSTNAGESFVRVPGSVGVSAVCLGATEDRLYGFAAVYDDARDHTWLLRIDLSNLEAFTIATIEASTGDDEMSEGARVAQLVWDHVYGRLWAAGGFGVKAFAP